MSNRVLISVRIKKSVRDKVAVMAARDSRSLSNMVECLLKSEIEAYERENGPIELTEEDLFGPPGDL